MIVEYSLTVIQGLIEIHKKGFHMEAFFVLFYRNRLISNEILNQGTGLLL